MKDTEPSGIYIYTELVVYICVCVFVCVYICLCLSLEVDNDDEVHWAVRNLLHWVSRQSIPDILCTLLLTMICISAKTQTYQYISAPPILCTLPLTMVYNSKNAIISTYISISDILPLTMHYAIREMGAMLLRISELCLSFSPDPNISDGFNIVHHFFTRKYSRKWKRGQLSLEQLEKEKVKVKS